MGLLRDNTGDVIISLATRQAIRARVACEEVACAVDLPHALWRHDWTGIRRIDPADRDAHFADDLDAVIIGGGGILLPLPGFGAFFRHGRAQAAWNAVCSQSTPAFDPTLAPFYAAVRAACERLAYLNVIYNACDVGINTSTGEGWGLVAFEHAASGGVQIVPEHSACVELWRDHGILAALDKSTHASYGQVCVEACARSMQALYRSPQTLREMARRSLDYASQDRWSWRRIATQWTTLLESLLPADRHFAPHTETIE